MASRAWIGTDARGAGLVALALAYGLAVGWLDSRPGWDDTGVTVGLLVLGSALAAALDGHRAWLFALLVGGPLVVIEVVPSGSTAPLVALIVTAVGASLGVLVGRALRPGARSS